MTLWGNGGGINEEMRTRTEPMSYIVLQINPAHSSMKLNSIGAKSHVNVTHET